MRAAVVALAGLVAAVAASAQDPLVCGAPIARTLAAGATHSYKLSPSPGASVIIQASDVSGTIGLIRMRVHGPSGTLVDTCSGVTQFTAVPGPMELLVSQCNGSSAGDYTVSLTVVSDDGGNCARPLVCGATPDGVGFAVAGESDSFLLSLNEEPVTLRLNYTDILGAPSLRLFDPDGVEVPLDGRCAGQISIPPLPEGNYTALVSACGRPLLTHPYRIELSDESCPSGPVITTFAVANAANDPIPPIGYDAAGRPVFNHPFGQGFSLVLEARAGANRHNPGVYPAPYFEGEDLQPPDMQMILSRPLGNGSAVICDTFPPELGGVPATVPFRFDDTPAALDIIHDMGCRFVDGAGQLVARQNSLEACTRSNDAFGFGFVDRGSRIQFCGLIATAWSFGLGDTVVGARIKDGDEEEFGAPREIVIRIGDPTPASVTPTPTPSPSPTRTNAASPTATRTRVPTKTATETPPTIRLTPTATRTRTDTRTATPTSTGATPTPGGTCAGDCNGDLVVSIADLTQVLNIVIGDAPLSACPAADWNSDGTLDIGDVIAAVGHALNGCP